jgi:capsular polysaccharide transport system permease protein
MSSISRFVIFLLVFLLPLAGVTVYELRYATDRFHSEASIIVTAERGAAPSLDLSVLGIPAPESQRDPLVLQEFISSTEMLHYLDDKLELRKHYSDPAIDWWSRLPAGYATEDFKTYLERYIVASLDTDSQVLSLHVEAFNREYAQKIVTAILERAQQFTDQLNEKVTKGQLKFFEDQLTNSERRLREAKAQLLAFQNENRVLNPEGEATLVSGNIAELGRELIRLQGELDTKLQVLAETAPSIVILKKQIATVKAQIEQERNRLTGNSEGAVNELEAQFREIQFNIEFVTNIYKSNLAQFEAAKVALVQRLKYLVVVRQPTIADASLYPSRGFIIGTAAMILFMVFFVVSLIISIIREHA